MKLRSAAPLFSILVAPFATAELVTPAVPPRGWNSFDGYGVYAGGGAIAAETELLAALYKRSGYDTVVIDNGWYGEYRLRPGTKFSAEKHASDIRIDANGRPLPSGTFFPEGFGPLIARCHELGLKFGVHLMRGIPRKAVEADLPIEGSRYRAGDIADKSPGVTCAWCPYNYRVDMTKPGAQDWYDSLIRKLAAEGVDFLKYDDITGYPDEARAILEAVRKVKRPMIVSFSPGDTVRPEHAADFAGGAMLRVTHDIWDRPSDIAAGFAAMRRWAGHEGRSPRPDLDMIGFGRLQSMTPSENISGEKNAVALAGLGSDRRSRFSPAQMRTFFAQRAMAGSPLFLGGLLGSYGELEQRIVTDPVALAADAQGRNARLIDDHDRCELWLLNDSGVKNAGWVAVFNRADREYAVKLRAAALGLTGPARLVPAFGRAAARLVPELPAEITVGPDDVALFRFEPEPAGMQENP